jgi:Mitochondrial ribosomal protein L37
VDSTIPPKARKLKYEQLKLTFLDVSKYFHFNFQIKPDSEYPDWLWTVHTGPPKTLEELDPETKAYWRRLRTAACRRNNQLQKIKKF